VHYDQAPHCVAYNGKQIIDNMSNNKVIAIQRSPVVVMRGVRVLFSTRCTRATARLQGVCDSRV
jgi:hypothetical protein